MKLGSWSSCGDGCGGRDEEGVGGVLALEKRNEKRELEMKRKSIYRFFGSVKEVQIM